MTHKHSRAGLTLLEVVVLVAFLFLLASIIIPAVTSPMGTPGYIRLVSNAGGIYKQVFAAATENTGGRTNYWAASVPNTTYADYEPTSTAYFRWLMTPYDKAHPEKGAGAVQLDFSIFHASGLPGVASLDDLSSETNPWVVVADLTETSTSGTPFLMTRNVNETRLKEWRPNERQALDRLGIGTYAEPYGKERLLVVRVGGGTEVLEKKRLLWEILNPNAATNRVLRP